MFKRSSVVWAALAVMVSLSGRASAQAPGKVELRLEPGLVNPGILGAAVNGLQIIAPERGSSTTMFGLGGSVGFLATPLLEPGVTLTLGILNNGAANSVTTTAFGMTPFF